MYFYNYALILRNSIWCEHTADNDVHLPCRKEKELLKAIETPEEKRARRLAKKVLKLI